MRKKIYFWATDYSFKSGEGVLAKKFVKDLEKNKKIKCINILNKNIFDTKKRNSFAHKYLLPYYGVIKIWIEYLKKNKVCFVNYLPLWNFLIFLSVPPNTILGPITGSISKKRTFLFKNFFENLSIFIIKKRFKKCLFANNFYQKEFSSQFHNYIIKNLKFEKTLKKKCKFDFIFYYRKNYDLDFYQKKIIFKLSNQNFKIALIGDKLNNKNIINFGYTNNNKLIKIISKTKCAIGNSENLYSFFIQSCLSKNCIVFYNKEFKKLENFDLNNFYPIPYDNINQAYKLIIKNRTKRYKINKNINLNFKNFFNYVEKL